MYSLPPAVLFNEQTGRLELQHAEIMRRVRRTNRLRSRYRSHVMRRLARFVLALPRYGLRAAAGFVATAMRYGTPRSPVAVRSR